MFDINRKQFIFKLSSGKVINVFYKHGLGICIRSLNKSSIWNQSHIILENISSNTWGNPITVLRKALPNFSACIDVSDNIHVLFQDGHANLVYLIFNSAREAKNKFEINNLGTHDKYPTILCIERTVYFFYILHYQGANLLFCQVLNREGSLQKPKLLDYIKFDKVPYKAVKNKKNEICLFYRNIREDKIQIGYRWLDPNSNDFGDFNSISDNGSCAEILSAAIDCWDSMHVCCRIKSGNGYEIVYMRKAPDSSEWNRHKFPFTSSGTFYNSSLLALENKIIVYCVKENKIVFCLSADKGYTWGRPELYPFYDGLPLNCILFMSNVQYEYVNACFQELPGNLSNGLRVAFLNDFYLKAESLVIDDMKTTVSDILKLISQNIIYIKKSIDEISHKIEALENKQNDLECQINQAKSHAPGSIETDLKNAGLNKPSHENSAPLLPGSGFSGITTEFLENMRKPKP